MHQRISFNNLCFPGASLASDIECWRSLGAKRIGVTDAKMLLEGWDASVDQLRAANFKIATIVHPFMLERKLDQPEGWDVARADLSRTLAAAKALGAETVYMVTGGRGALSWEQAAEAFCTAVGPGADEARRLGIDLLIESAPILYADVHITHSLRDTVQLAEQAGVGVCIDIFSCWTEAGLRQSIERAMKRCHLVQVSDYVLGDRAFSCRAVPGDGVIPLERMIGWILEFGYKGAFDLELIGPRIDKEGHYEAVKRTGVWLGNLLSRLGA
jgi:sugar phosphate isomerase/epimerase